MAQEVLQEVHKHGFIDGKEYEFVKVTHGIVPISDPRTGAKSSMGYSIEYLDANRKIVAVRFSKIRPYEFGDLMPRGDVPRNVIPRRDFPRVEFPNVGRNRSGITEKPPVEHDKPIVSVTLRVMVGKNTEEVVFPGDSDIVKKIDKIPTTSKITIYKYDTGYEIVEDFIGKGIGKGIGKKRRSYIFDRYGGLINVIETIGMHKEAEFQSGQEKVKTKSKIKQARVIKMLNNDR